MKAKPALHGGKPVRDSLLSYGRQTIEDDDIAAVTDVLRSNWLTTGPKVAEFERAFADVTGSKEAVAVSNGTAALHTTMFALDIGPGDEVIVPALTFAASSNCVLYQGGTPVFADVKPDTLLIDPADVATKITPRTRAIVAVDYTGQPCDYDALRSLAEQHGLALVADACHALGGSYQGNAVGSLADLSTFSLHPVKPITTGEGGVITTNDPELAQRMRVFRSHGITSDHRQRELAGSWFYEMVELGYNYRLTDLQCALGLSQLKKLPAWVARRSEIAELYDERLAPLSEIQLPVVRDDCQSGWHLYVIRLYLETLSGGRGDIFQALRAENIGVQVHYIPVPWHPYYQNLGYRKGQWPVAEAAYERLISLPIFPAMSDRDADDVIAACFKVIEAFRK